jgi:Helicase associated domain
METKEATKGNGKNKEPLNRISWDEFLRFVDPPPQKPKKKTTCKPPNQSVKRSMASDLKLESKKSDKKTVKKKQASAKGVLADKTNRKSRDRKGWDGRIEELKAYKASNGNCLVPYNYSENPSLARWVCNTRYFWKGGKLSQDRVRQLEEIGFPLNI